MNEDEKENNNEKSWNDIARLKSTMDDPKSKVVQKQ